MTLREFESNLNAAAPGLVHQLAAPKKLERYAVWHRYGRDNITGDNRNQLDAPRVQIDIISNVLDDTLADDIAAALWLMDLPYNVVSEGYDDDYAAYRTILQLVVI